MEEHYRVIYFEALDLITACISDCFDQPGYKTYGKVQALLLKAAALQPYEEELRFVLSFYGSGFDPMLLATHLQIFPQNFPATREVVLSDILNFIRCCIPSQWQACQAIACYASDKCRKRAIL